MPILSVSIGDLLKARTIETSRLEFKNGLSEQQVPQVTATIAAFANDLQNLNGGYIILGVSEINGIAQLPPVGIDPERIDDYQKKIRGQCNRIVPEYYPGIEPIDYQGSKLLILHCPAGEARLYKAPSVRGGERSVYYIRQGSETVEANGQIEEELPQQTARVPFGDSAYTSLDYDVLSPILIKKHLQDVRSRLASEHEPDLGTFENMRIVKRINGHTAPLNVGVMFFTSSPDEYFPGLRTEIVQFGDDAGGNLLEEKYFTGPLPEQIRSVLRYLGSLSTTLVEKSASRAEARRSEAFPLAAIEEALVNAYYHRGYDTAREPVKVYLYPDRMEIISYPGPVAGIKQDQFQVGHRVPPVPNRNRRIGEFLKELRLAEMRNTGIPKIIRTMSDNGSPLPQFDFDDDRTYFRVTLPAHPDYVVLQSLRETAYLWATGQQKAAINRLEETIRSTPTAGQVYSQLIDYKLELGDLQGAEITFDVLKRQDSATNKERAYISLAQAYMQYDQPRKAIQLLGGLRESDLDDNTLISLATNHKKVDQLSRSHQIFLTITTALRTTHVR